MPKIDSNFTGLSFAEEETIGVLPGVDGDEAVWIQAEPNSYSDFGGETKTVARTPINATRQRRKGTVVGIDANVGVQIDFIQSAVLRYLQSFFFAKARAKPDTQPLVGDAVPITSVTSTTFVAASGLTFLAGHLVLSEDFTTPANNKLSLLSAASGTTLTTTGLTAEASPPATARIQAVGFQFNSGDLAFTYAGGLLTGTLTTGVWTDKGLNVGEWIYIGGDETVTQPVTTTRIGFARIKTLASKVITFDKTTFTAAADAGTAKTIRIFFGPYLRNEALRANIVRTTLQFERTLDSDANGVQAEYVPGCVANEFTFNLPTEDKITADMTFVGIDSETRTGLEGLKDGTRVTLGDIQDDAYNTSNDLVRAHLSILDQVTTMPTALFGYALDGTLTISNGATPNKALARAVAWDVSVGDFAVGGSLNAYFESVSAVRAVRQNSSLGLDVIAAKGNAGFVWDIPHLTLGGGKPEIEKDGPVMIPLEIMGAENVEGYSMSYTQFPYLPTVAMPV